MLKSIKLKLGQKLTILLLCIFLGGIIASGVALSSILNRAAQAQIASQALILMETMNSVRDYTNNQVRPELSHRLAEEFLPEAIPTYSSREVFENFRNRQDHEAFFYKDATLNPINLRDKADAFETAIVERFRRDNNLKEVSGFRSTPIGDVFYIARPFQVNKQSCLECHGMPGDALQSMIDRYGDTNGFGWKLNEIVAAQIVSVPAAATFRIARHSLAVILGMVTVVFAIAIFMVNLWLKRYVVRPLNRMAMVAEAVSTGDTDADFGRVSNDEVGKLAQSFNRMRMSLNMAIQRLGGSNMRRRNSTSGEANVMHNDYGATPGGHPQDG